MYYAMGQTTPPLRANAATQTDPAPASMAEYIAPAPAVYAAPAHVYASAATTPAPMTELSDFLEPPVLVVQVVQTPQVQFIGKQLRLQSLFLVKAPKLLRVWDLLPFAMWLLRRL